ncbi:MAG: ComEC/Rec2 family competence protein [Candidatus Andersenbacteria bacterium]
MRLVFPLLVIAIVGLSTFDRTQTAEVVFLDVGQGDAILLQDGSYQVLIDGGKGAAVLERLAEELPSHDRKIEVVVVTHAHQDHMEGLVHLLQRYDVNLVVLPNVPYESQLQEAWITAIEDEGSAYRFAWYGQQLQVGAFDLKILAPFDNPATVAAARRDVNNASTVIRADIHGTSFLLTGDAEAPIERLLVQTIPQGTLDVDVLKVGHHGSNTSTTQELLAATTPSFAVISAGKDNQYGHPHKDVLERLRGIPILRTDLQSSIRFTYAKQGWTISCGSKSELRLRPKSCTQDETLTVQVF